MRNFTAFKKSTTILFLSLILFFTITSISCADTPIDSLNKDSGKYLSFYEKVDGETIHWEANFMGDEITSIYKNGKKIPDDLLADYKDKVYDQLDEMRFGENRYSFNMPVVVGKDFNIDMDELNKELEEMQKNLPNLEENFKMYQFDNEEFKKQMEELKKQFKENKFKIYKFNDEKLKEQMKELQKNLEELKIKPEDFNFYFESEEDTEA